MLLGAFLDPLVDRPEHFFVVCGRLGEVHAGIVPRFVPDTKWLYATTQTPPAGNGAERAADARLRFVRRTLARGRADLLRLVPQAGRHLIGLRAGLVADRLL